MNERLDSIRLIPDINKPNQESVLSDRLRFQTRKIAALALIGAIGVAGTASINHKKNPEYPKVSKQTTELVNYNLDHATSTVDIEVNDNSAMLEIKVDKTS